MIAKLTRQLSPDRIFRGALNELCDTNPSVKAVTLRVNGGTNGLADRQMYYERCQAVIP